MIKVGKALGLPVSCFISGRCFLPIEGDQNEDTEPMAEKQGI